MKQLFTVSANHPADVYRLHKQIVEVGIQDVPGTGRRYSAFRAGFGYVCGFASPDAAIRDLLQANGCTNIRIEYPPTAK